MYRILFLYFLCHDVFGQIGDSQDVFLKKVLNANGYVLQVSLDGIPTGYIVANEEPKRHPPNVYYFSEQGICVMERIHFEAHRYTERCNVMTVRYGNPIEVENNVQKWAVEENGLTLLKVISADYDTKYKVNVVILTVILLNNLNDVIEIDKKFSSSYTKVTEKRLK